MLFEDVYLRKAIEACGVLLGRIDEEGRWQVEAVYPLENVFQSPVYFEFAPEDLLSVELNYPGQVIGVYHSHPTGYPVASRTDRQNMQRVNVEEEIPWVWLIISGPFDEHFPQLVLEEAATIPIIAYHHYPQEGLQQVAIEFEG